MVRVGTFSVPGRFDEMGKWDSSEEEAEPEKRAPVTENPVTAVKSTRDCEPVSSSASINRSAPPIKPCRSVHEYENLNLIDEGSYGIVYRARNRESGEIVALKKLKLEKEVNGFPVTSLREINTLIMARHRHVVNVVEILVNPDAYQPTYSDNSFPYLLVGSTSRWSLSSMT